MLTVLIIIFLVAAVTRSPRLVISLGVISSLLFAPVAVAGAIVCSIAVAILPAHAAVIRAASVFALATIVIKNTATETILFAGFSFVMFQFCYELAKKPSPSEPGASILGRVARMTFFPQLLCGPVLPPDAYHFRRFTSRNRFQYGAVLGASGIFIKAYITYALQTVPLDQTGIIRPFIFLFLLYSDLLAWSLTGVGIASMVGMRFPRSFRFPLKALSLSQFYRRWNVTIFRWAMSFIAPLFGTRQRNVRSKLTAMLSISMVLALWHGVSWGFFAFGCLNLLGSMFQTSALKRSGAASQAFVQAALLYLISIAFEGAVPALTLPQIGSDAGLLILGIVLIVLHEIGFAKASSFMLRNFGHLAACLSITFAATTLAIRPGGGFSYAYMGF